MNYKTLTILLLLLSFNLHAQKEIEKEAMSKLSFLIGDWKGKTKIFSKDSIKTGEVHEKVKYLLGGELMSIEVKSPFVHLNTIIRYSVKDSTYYYHPFSKTGGDNFYKGRIEDGKFVVTIDDNYKVFFEKTKNGEFHEYGERIINGNKKITFEDLLEPISLRQQKMKELDFLIGEWVGTSTLYENGEIKKQVPSFNKASYGVKDNIIIIDSNSEMSRIHTVIYYDEKDETYYFQYFSASGRNKKLPAEHREGQLIVKTDNETRYIFGKIDGGHGEVGEKLINGKWVKFYEDRVVNTN